MVEAARVTALATERSLHCGVDVWTLSRPLVDLPARHVLASHGPLVLSDGPDAFRRVSRQLRGGPGHAARRRSIRQRSSGIHTAASSPAHNSLARARASSRSVFARACVIPVSSGLTTTTRFTCGSRIRATSQQLPVTSNATRSDGSELSANVPRPSGVLGTRPAERTCPSSQIATTQRSRSTSKPIARPPPHQSDPNTSTDVVDSQRENQRDNDTDRYELKAQSRQVAGAAERKARARSPSIKLRPTRLRSPEKPLAHQRERDDALPKTSSAQPAMRTRS
jgi:hypothetical protein